MRVIVKITFVTSAENTSKPTPNSVLITFEPFCVLSKEM